ncbi:helix-turn-helix domain-containing protein [Sorangium sp. So ce269]
MITDAFASRASTSTASTPHAQHGALVAIGLDSDVTVTGPGGARVRARVLVVPPDVAHTVACPGPSLGILYDPEVVPHVAAYARLRGGAFPLEGRLGARLGEALVAHRASLARADVLDGLAREASAWFAREAPRREPDGRVARFLEALRDPTADPRLAVPRRMSPAHLRALFVRDVGLPIRTFRLWRRLLTALAALSTLERIDATGAAHAAGFADLAHFSRTCRRMLGYSPTALRSRLLRT